MEGSTAARCQVHILIKEFLGNRSVEGQKYQTTISSSFSYQITEFSECHSKYLIQHYLIICISYERQPIIKYSGQTLNQTNTQHKHQNRDEIR